MMGVKYLKKGFYAEKSNLIGEAVKSYANAKDNGVDNENLEKIKRTSEEILGNVMYENGYREDDNKYISIEKEFFTEKGGLDEEKLAKFQRLMVCQYGLQDVKWTFAGTTACLTQTSKKILEEKGKNYADYLPIELKRKYEKEQKEKYISKDPGTCTILVFPDGSISSEYDSKKAKMTFESLKDNSGFDWNSGYSPDNKVERKGWIAGFNKDGVWEAIKIDEKKVNVETVTLPSSKIVFTEETDEKMDKVGFISLSGLKIEDLLEDDDVKEGDLDGSAILFDENALLMDGEEEKYYSLTGEVYGVRDIDKEESIKGIKDSLKKMEIEKLHAVVLKTVNEETVKYYTEKFNEMIDKDTRFYARSDKKLADKLGKIKESIKQKDISKNIVEGVYNLIEKNRTGEEAYKNLVPSTITPVSEVNLQIYANKKDMDRFLSLPELEELMDDETKSYIANMNVPEEHEEEMSNVTQDIIHSYNDKYKSTQLDKVDLLEISKEVLVDNNLKRAGQINTYREISLPDFIKHSQGTFSSSGFNGGSFGNTDSGKKISENKYDIFNEKEFNEWGNKQNIAPEMLGVMKKYIDQSKIDDSKKEEYSQTLQNVFKEYNSIKTSLGMKPEETAAVIKQVVVDNKVDQKYNSKKIYFEKDLASLIKEAAKENKYTVNESKQDIYLRQKNQLISGKPLNLKNSTDYAVFANSMVMKDLPGDTRNDILNYVKNTNVSAESAEQWSEDVINAIQKETADISGMKKSFSRSSYVPGALGKVDVTGGDDNTKMSGSDADNKRMEFEKILSEKYSELGMNVKNIESRYNFPKSETGLDFIPNLLSSSGFSSFTGSDVFKKTGLGTDQLKNIISQNESAYHGLHKRYYNEIPLSFKTMDKAASSEFGIMSGVDTVSNLRDSEMSNNVYNVGWVERKVGNDSPKIGFTNKGQDKISEVSQEKIELVSKINNNPEMIGDFETAPTFTFEDLRENYATPKVTLDIPRYNDAGSDFVYAKSQRASLQQEIEKMRLQRMMSQQSQSINLSQGITQDTGMVMRENPVKNKPLSAEEQKMKRIEDNYYADKQQLAKQQDSSESGSKGAGQTGNVSKQSLEEAKRKLIKEISNDIL